MVCFLGVKCPLNISFAVQTVGSQVLVKIVKNKLSPPFKTAQFELEFGKGISQESELIDLALKHKFASKAGAMYRFNDQSFRGKDAFKQFLSENDSVREEMKMKLKEKLLGIHKEPETGVTDEDSSEELVSPDSTDEEGVAAVEA